MITTADLRAMAEQITRAGIRAADARKAVRRVLGVSSGLLKQGDLSRPLAEIDRIVVLGAGKAAGMMARAVEEALGEHLHSGMILLPHGVDAPELRSVVLRGGHPVADEDGVASTARLLELAGELTARDHAIVVLSGGASALLAAPAPGLTLHDLGETARVLLASGADISDMNTLRRHLSAVSGGWLAAVLHPCPSWTLIVSDVIGDDPITVGSGPTLPDPTSFAHAQAVIDRYALWNKLPPAVIRHVQRGLAGEVEDTPKPGNPWFDIAQHDVILRGVDAVEGALAEARALGFHTLRGSLFTEGEASVAGLQLAERALRLHRTTDKPVCLIAGGETTVTEPGDGAGGRNQELALVAAQQIAGYPGVVVFSVGTDGIDGASPAAGAIVDGGTASRVRAGGWDVRHALATHNSYPALLGAGDALITGPTGTNVMDLMGCLVLGSR
jgi:glycerate 2-kinase